MFYSNIYLLIYIYMITKSRFIYNLLLLNSLNQMFMFPPVVMLFLFFLFSFLHLFKELLIFLWVNHCFLKNLICFSVFLKNFFIWPQRKLHIINAFSVNFKWNCQRRKIHKLNTLSIRENWKFHFDQLAVK